MRYIAATFFCASAVWEGRRRRRSSSFGGKLGEAVHAGRARPLLVTRNDLFRDDAGRIRVCRIPDVLAARGSAAGELRGTFPNTRPHRPPVPRMATRMPSPAG